MRTNHLFLVEKNTESVSRTREYWVEILLVLFLLAFLSCGCSTAKVDKTDVPQAPVTESAAAPTPTPAPTRERYEIKKGDTLWDIAGRTAMYGDSFQWPLLFKANRDVIQDPDLIYPGQNLSVERNVSQDERDGARKAASDTPVYSKHDHPRSKLPVDYF